jgi:hypothetical protein
MTIPGASPLPTTFEIKGGKVRWNLSPMDGDSAGYRIYDASARRLFTVLPQQPSVLVDVVAAPSGTASPGDGGSSWSFSHLGDGRAGGYPCERMRATSGSQVYELCAAHGILPVPLQYALPNAASALPFLGELEARGVLPLAAATREGPPDKTYPSPRLATSLVQRGPIDAARFVVPDYPQRTLKHPLAAPGALPR